MKLGYRINQDFTRAAPELVERFRDIPTGNVVDALDRVSAMHYSIKPIEPGMKLLGCAMTVKTFPGDNLIVNKAIAMSGPGLVIVIDNGQFEGGSTWGDLTSFMAKNAAAAGMVTNGLVRDVVGIREAGLPVYARGTVPNGGFKRGPGEIGYPVVCGGISVKPGDIIVGDVDGVVVVPLEVAAEAADRIPAILENERKTMENIRKGMVAPANLDEMMRKGGYE